MNDSSLEDNHEASTGRHAAREHKDGVDGPGGTAPSAGQSEGGGAPTQQETTHSGYAPTDTGGTESEAAHSGHPAGMAPDGTNSEGGGADNSGRHHTGWGPADGEVNDA